MRQQIVSQSAVGASSIITTDTYISPFNVGFGVVATGTVTYTIQHTFDNPQNTGGPVTWYAHPTIAAKSDNQDGNYAFPVSAIRINVSASTAGSATLTVIQAGQVGG